jgi:hypothetical protein
MAEIVMWIKFKVIVSCFLGPLPLSSHIDDLPDFDANFARMQGFLVPILIL